MCRRGSLLHAREGNVAIEFIGSNRQAAGSNNIAPGERSHSAIDRSVSLNDKENSRVDETNRSSVALKISFEQLTRTDDLIETWITRYITITAGIASAIGAILSLSDETAFPSEVKAALVALAIIGAISNYVVTNHIMRLTLWQDAHGIRFRELEAMCNQPSAFVEIESDKYHRAAEAKKYYPLRVIVPFVRHFFCLMWILIAAYFLLRLFHSPGLH